MKSLLVPARHLALPLALAAVLPAFGRQAGAPKPPRPAAAPDAPAAVADSVSISLSDDSDANVHDKIRQAQVEVTRASRDIKRQLATKFHLIEGGLANSRTLLVPADDASPEQIGRLREELAIMGRIFTKAADPEGAKHGGFRFNFGGLGFGQGGELDALYLDGYGAVFPLEVDFPLVDTPKFTEKKTEPKPDKDATWEKTRRELAGGHEDEPEEALDLGGDSGPTPYDADKVAALRKRLTEAFRHAANLKSVKPDEQIVVQVSGPAGQVGHVSRKIVTKVVAYAKSGDDLQMLGSPEDRGGPVRQQLTLRAKKSDVDAFAVGKLSPEDFGRKLKISARDGAPAP